MVDNKEEIEKKCKICNSFTLMGASNYLGYNECGICTGQTYDKWLTVDSNMVCGLFN